MRKLITCLIALLLTMPCLLFAQNKTITGRITTSNGTPITNASVIIRNSGQGTLTDAEGRFKITAPVNASIVINATGFKPETRAIGQVSDEVNIQLQEDIARLEEVIVTGLATSVKRRNLSNAVATISSRELNGVAPPATFDVALEGKIPGAYINANSGAPGGGVSVKLRGVTSVYGNTQPLYVLDGVYVDNTATSGGLNIVTQAVKGASATSTQDNPSSRIADLRAEDIENIEILKGASAAAIYGSRASGGVIIITTKRGKPGRTNISVSQDLGRIEARKLIGVRQFTKERAASLSSDPATSVALGQQFLAAQSAGHIYDYEKEMFGNKGFVRNTGISVSGGSERTTFYLSAAQKDEGGIIKNTGYRNSTFRLNLDHQVNDNIKVGVSTSYINSSADRSISGNDNNGVSLGIALSSTPSFAQLFPDKDGNYPNNPFAASNPLQTIALMRNNESVNRLITGVSLEAILQKSRTSTTRIVGKGGLDFYNLETNVLFPRNLQFQAVNKGTSILGTTRNLNTNYILSLVNAWSVSDDLVFTSSGGITKEQGDYNNLLNAATQLSAGQSNVDQGSTLTGTQFRTKFQNDGVFVQEEAAIADALNLTAGVRFDRSSNNGDVAKYYTYPKGGVSLNLTKLGFWPAGGLLDVLKLRAAYGQATNVPAYGSKFTSMLSANIQGYPGLIVNVQKGDPNIKPERQTEFETGVDLSLFKGRLGLTATYYNKVIRDFLMLGNLPASSGFSAGWVNAGDLRNRGVELSINARPVSTKAITWNTSVNWWLNRSLVTRYTLTPIPQGSFGYVLGSFQIQQGSSATQILGLNGAGVGKLGDTEPRFQMSNYNEVTFFEKLSLRFLLHWKKGGDNVNLTNLETDFGGTSFDYDKVTNKLNVPDGVYRLMQIGSDAHMFVQDASYLKIRELGLYYTLNNFPFHAVRSVRIGVSVNNFITFTKYRSYDPEVSNFGTGFSTGVDVDPYPPTKRAVFHISVDF